MLSVHDDQLLENGLEWKKVKKLLTFPSARAEMTFPKADRDLLIFFASSSTEPSAPVLLTLNKYVNITVYIYDNDNHTQKFK